MTRSIEEEEAEDVNVPHAIDSRHESRSVLECLPKILVPFIGSLGHLTNDESDDCESGSQDCGQHQELESPDDALVVESADVGHVGEGGGSAGDGGKDSPDHVAQEQEVKPSRDTSQDDKSKSQIGSKIRDPDGVERVLELDASLTHVKHKQAETAKENHG